jgi:hypothetical protein
MLSELAIDIMLSRALSEMTPQQMKSLESKVRASRQSLKTQLNTEAKDVKDSVTIRTIDAYNEIIGYCVLFSIEEV